MASKFHQQNIFESGFDSFELDDGFLLKIDSELKKNKINERQLHTKLTSKPGYIQQKNDEKNLEYYDKSLFIEDLNDSDFFDFNNEKNKQHSPKVLGSCKNKEEEKSSTDCFTNNSSPIQGQRGLKQINLSSSTPLRPNSDSFVKSEANSDKNLDFVYLEADLFDDWDIDEYNTQKSSQKSTVTLSQALQLVEEAKREKMSNEKEILNESINLLTGETVGGDIGVMFDESFGSPKSVQEKLNETDSSNNSVFIVKDFKTTSKPAAAQKLNFEPQTENHFENVCFASEEDDFDFLTQELLSTQKPVLKCSKSPSLRKPDYVTPLTGTDLNDSDDEIVLFNKKRGKCHRVIKSDSAEDSPSPKFRRKNKIKVKGHNRSQQKVRKQFIQSEAEVSDELEISSDEAEEDGEYDKSFLDEKSYFTQNCSANMTSKYLESVKSVNRPGGFKIPPVKPYNPDNILSQIPEDSGRDYEIDSFCVNDVEEEMQSDLSDLEVAEKILEMDRKKRKRKKFQKLKK